MTKRYSVVIDSQLCIITDHLTGGKLTVKQHLTPSYIDKLTDNDTNPLVEFSNSFYEEIGNRNLTLRLIGTENTVTFTDDNVPIFEGGVTLQKVDLVNPFIGNSTLRNVQVLGVDECHISHSSVDDFKHVFTDSRKLHLSHCFINDAYPINNSARRTEFLMNKCRNGEMW